MAGWIDRRVVANKTVPTACPTGCCVCGIDVDCTPGPLESAVRSAVSRYAALVIGDMDKLPIVRSGLLP